MSKSDQAKNIPQITAEENWTAPSWALMQRAMFDKLNVAAVEYVARYTRSDNTLIWRNDWPGMDGSDDPYEAFMNLSLLYALGGSEEVGRLAGVMWESLTWQWTQYGQIHNEFDGYYDWMHHGEGYLYFYFLGLSDPESVKLKQRAVRFSRMYTGDDPQAPNYDKEKRLIRSPITGSRGPRFEMTEEDWVTHRGVLDDYLAPFEDIPGVDFASGKCKWSDDEIYGHIIRLMNERQAKGDVPLNLNATGMMAHTFMLTGDDTLRSWVKEYIAVWEERTAQNQGLIPDNVGLNGEIGEYNDGKWWGGYYGWRWPHGYMTIIEPVFNACANALLLTGEKRWLELARSVMDKQWSLGVQQQDGFAVPNRHFDAGWTDYRPFNVLHPIHLWFLSRAEEDLERVNRVDIPAFLQQIDIPVNSGRNAITHKETKHFIGNTIPWFLFMQGKFEGYPEQILEANMTLIDLQIAKMRSTAGDPLNWNWDDVNSIHQWQEYSPVYFEGLLQLTLGAPMHISHGGLQHASVRYYDGAKQRPGLPEGVAALIDKLEDNALELTLINTDLFASKEVIVQAGSFGEHQFTEAVISNYAGDILETLPIAGKWLRVAMQPGSGLKLRLGMDRYVHQPSYATPWFDPADAVRLIEPRATT
ncbi:hypothetical protein EBB07_04925 [Paenibacillaceae bacterium]|nr:hypothetical protein EBB07_04925 [Paenibacillaceae bacterium]